MSKISSQIDRAASKMLKMIFVVFIICIIYYLLKTLLKKNAMNAKIKVAQKTAAKKLQRIGNDILKKITTAISKIRAISAVIA